MPMLFRQIEYFQAVVESSSFYEAAERCHVSQSAISQQVRKLEAALSVRLLDLHTRPFSLTPAGEVFYRRSLVLRADVRRSAPHGADVARISARRYLRRQLRASNRHRAHPARI